MPLQKTLGRHRYNPHTNVNQHHHRIEERDPDDYPTHPAPGGGNYEGGRVSHQQKYPEKDELPFQPAKGGATTKRPGIRERLRERFSEKPATREEIEQLKLDTEREKYKTLKYGYKKARPSAFEKIIGGGQRQQSRGSSRSGGSGRMSRPLSGGYTMGENATRGFGMSNQPTWGRGLDKMLGSGNSIYGEQKPKRYTKKEQPRVFGDGLKDLFSI